MQAGVIRLEDSSGGRRLLVDVRGLPGTPANGSRPDCQPELDVTELQLAVDRIAWGGCCAQS